MHSYTNFPVLTVTIIQFLNVKNNLWRKVNLCVTVSLCVIKWNIDHVLLLLLNCRPERSIDYHGVVSEIVQIHCSGKLSLLFPWVFLFFVFSLAREAYLDCWHCPKWCCDGAPGIFIKNSNSNNIWTKRDHSYSVRSKVWEVWRTMLRFCFIYLPRFVDNNFMLFLFLS